MAMLWCDDIPERPLEPPETRDEEWPVCPCCGRGTDTLYKIMDGDIVGCSECIRAVPAWN